MFNLCYRSDATNTLFRQLLMDAFKQLVTEATQIMGRLNAHVYWRGRSPEEIIVIQTFIVNCQIVLF